MEKIHIGDKVAYKDSGTVLGKMLPSGTAEDIIPDGMPVGNGETNKSGQDIIICKPDGCNKQMMMFLRSELIKL